MASQADLEAQIAQLNADIAEALNQLSILQLSGDDPAAFDEINSYITSLEQQLSDAEQELANLTTVFFENDGTGSTTADIGVPLSKPPTTEAYQGPAYDDEGNLLPGWSTDENGNPVYVGGDFVEPATLNSAAASRASFKGLTSSLLNTRSQATQQDSTNAYSQGDWRVRLSLAPGANYLYKSDVPGILEPLIETNGVLFPYTPSVSVSYAANYDPTELVHSNYKIFQYRSSSVDQITIGCDFTAQDTKEATYLLAVIHFFRSITKMFYGQDQNPKNGTPPPLCYLTGMGSFQFDRHPLAITNFSLNLPTDVDYIRAGSTTAIPGTNAGAQIPKNNISNRPLDRLTSSITKIGFGGTSTPPAFKSTPSGSVESTYVPTKLQIQISAVPIVSRNDISNTFSLRDYATGKLLRGSKNGNGTGIW